jgi:E3 ubiquitin-protein ligase listerin
MSRRAAKPRAASGKAFAGASSGAFGAFSTATSGSRLSYLTEPPDFLSISDANVVVSFKNLLKKDATTKSKALEDLLAYVEAHPYEQDGGAEEPVLEAWVGCDCDDLPCVSL